VIDLTKDEFNKLDINEQIKYLNTQLKEGNSLTIICKTIGIARSTVGGRVKKQGYIFDKLKNQYILENKKHNGRAYSKLIVSDLLTSENETVAPQTVSSELTISNNENTGLMLSSTDSDNLGYLLKNIDILKDFIEGSKKSNSTNEVNSLEDIINDIYKFKQEKRNYKVKSLRIDADILNDFESIANDLSYKGINQQEFLNYILKSYIDFYKRF
jgi:predicted DNA binding CopG/RHH family protein